MNVFFLGTFNHWIASMDVFHWCFSFYGESLKGQLLQLSIDIFDFRMAKLSALKLSHKVKNSIFPHLYSEFENFSYYKTPILEMFSACSYYYKGEKVVSDSLSRPRFDFMKCYKFCGKKTHKITSSLL